MSNSAMRDDPVQLALDLIRAGQLTSAEAICRQVLREAPRDFNALQLLGHVMLQRSEYAQATQWLEAAIAVRPTNAQALSNLAAALLALQRPREALDQCHAALALRPDLAEASINEGHALSALGRHSDALAPYDRAIALVPMLFDAHLGRSRALFQLARYADSLEGSNRASQLAANRPEGWCNRGMALLKLKRPEEALTAFDQALALSPNQPEVLNNRGTALRDLGRLQDAVNSYERALALRSEFAEAYCNLANIAVDTGRSEDAMRLCDRALQIKPDLLDALNTRGTALRMAKRYEDAVETYEKLLSLSPCFGHAASHLVFVRNSICEWADHDQAVAAIVRRVIDGESVCTPHIFLGICASAAAQLQCARTFVADHFPPVPALWQGERYAHRRIRVAYLSADFNDHPVAHLVAGVLERHDRTRFETVGVSLRRESGADPMRQRMRSAFEHFHDATEWSDRDAARRLRDLEIDIAVDLTAHTRDGRLGILSHRPAPVQIHYLGFAGSCGASFIDYMIADAVTVPPYEEQHFEECIVRLPHSFLPNDDCQPIAEQTPTRGELGLPEEGFVFCALHNPYKLNPGTFDMWMRLVRDTPGSVLWLRGGGRTLVGNLIREAGARGVDPQRLVFASRTDTMDAHLARYRQADLFLDTMPYGGHATARDALWAGLPVITCNGAGFASRVAASLLLALDLPELVTADAEAYVERALSLAHSPSALFAIRTKLARNRISLPAFNTDLYRRHLERAYIELWSRTNSGNPASSLDVPAELP